MENLEKNFSTKNVRFNEAFYKKFYSLSCNDKDLRDHYNTIGVSKHLIPNEEACSDILYKMLNFNTEVYISNISATLNCTIVKNNNNNDYSNLKWIKHFYGGVFGGEKGQLETINIYRFINTQELYNNKSKWDDLLLRIYKHFNFDPNYYMFMNIIDADKTPFEQWITQDIFKNKHPNLKSFNENVNLLSEMFICLHSQSIDLNYIMNEYGSNEIVKKFIGNNSNLTNLEIPLFIFLNLAKKYGFFWNKLERETYITEHLTKYNELIDKLKSMTPICEIELIKLSDMYKQKTLQLTTKKSPVELTFPSIKVSIDKLVANISLLKKITEQKYISNFKKINELTDENVLSKLLTVVLKNALQVADIKEYNSMQLKTFVLSFFYNAKLQLKQTMPKEEFISTIKNMTTDFLTEFFKENELTQELESLLKDLDFLIENKKIIKFTKLSVMLASFIV